MTGLHHVELWLEGGTPSWSEWAWLLDAVGFELTSEWSGGQTWCAGVGPYLTLTTSPNLVAG